MVIRNHAEPQNNAVGSPVGRRSRNVAKAPRVMINDFM
jgi:hypothetical protein